MSLRNIQVMIFRKDNLNSLSLNLGYQGNFDNLNIILTAHVQGGTLLILEDTINNPMLDIVQCYTLCHVFEINQGTISNCT